MEAYTARMRVVGRGRMKVLESLGLTEMAKNATNTIVLTRARNANLAANHCALSA